jgi:hypothetical protein
VKTPRNWAMSAPDGYRRRAGKWRESDGGNSLGQQERHVNMANPLPNNKSTC